MQNESPLKEGTVGHFYRHLPDESSQFVSVIDRNMTFTTFPYMEAHAMYSRNVNKITITLVNAANASVRLIPN